MMGNLTSCAGRSHSLLATSAVLPPASPSHIPISPASARVLLADGSVLTFTTPIKVISLLLDYPFHVICPVDSLRPGHHSLSSLLPDEELELGQLYLLLPLKTFESRECMPNMEPLIRRNRLIISSHHQSMKLMQKQLSVRSLAVQAPLIRDQQTLFKPFELIPEAARECEDQSVRLLCGHRSDVGSSDFEALCDSNSDRSREKVRRRLTSMATFSSASFHSFKPERQSASASSHGRAQLSKNDQCCSRICNTPDLQLAYRSVMLRRCRSWTPRLQPITENKVPKSANTLD
ncbi:hypothetical protein L7F22_038564 [Adiantum nelumboides]|nr:hypothetical protein [Adiantum nelumboides]